MAIGDVVVLDDFAVDLDAGMLMERPPFSRWAASRSGAAVAESVDRLVGPVTDAIDPRGIYRILPQSASTIDAYDPPIGLTAGEYVIAGLLTIGDTEPATDTTGTKLDGFVRDAIENAGLQSARETALEALRERTEALGFNTTRVYAPGTRDDTWPLECRRFMFDALPAGEIGVSLNAIGNIQPPKTFTFAMGCGPDVDQAEVLLSCADCAMVTDCVYGGSATVA